MGNSQSHANLKELKEQQRLSKPKTIPNAATSTTRSPSFKAEARMSTSALGGSMLTETLTESPPSSDRKLMDLRQQKSRSQLHLPGGDPSEGGYHCEQDDELGDLPSPSARDRMSTSVSPQPSSSRLPTGSQTSLVLDPRTIDLQTAVVILEELRKTASPDDLVALRKAQMATAVR
jgi:hypothetical protein